MNTEPTVVQPDGSIDIGSQLPDVNSMISSIVGPMMWVSIALTVLFALLYMYSMTRRRKVERAILDMQKILIEMNERDKARLKPASERPQSRNETIAATDSSEKPPVS